MKLHIFESTYYGLRAVTALAVINKSVKLGIPRRYQKSWTMKTVAPEFTIQEMKSSIEAEAKRWESKTLARIARDNEAAKETATTA